MQARTRVLAVVFVVAVAAAAGTVLVTALTSSPEPKKAVICPKGPPLDLDLGVRTDAQARALRRGDARLAAGHRDAARTIFAHARSVDGQVGLAVASWPGETIADLRTLAGEYPRNGTVALNLGSALFCDGEPDAARAQWQSAKALAPDSAIGVRAADLLHPEYVRGIPVFVPSFAYPQSLAGLSPQQQLAALARGARRPDVRAKLLYGRALQQLQRQRSAEREYAAAARLAPDDAEAQVAAAVGRFDKDRPAAAFSRLGPLTRRFPRSPTVRFHLGLLLLWIGRIDAGKVELRRAQALAPRSPLGREAGRFLGKLRGG